MDRLTICKGLPLHTLYWVCPFSPFTNRLFAIDDVSQVNISRISPVLCCNRVFHEVHKQLWYGAGKDSTPLPSERVLCPVSFANVLDGEVVDTVTIKHPKTRLLLISICIIL